MSLQNNLEHILEEYPTARARDPFGAQHQVHLLFAALSTTLSSAHSVASRAHLRVRWSVGRGNWSRVPWVAFLDERETMSTQNGVYPVFLFREDMTGVYITFNQGVTELKEKHGTPEARRVLRDRASQLREYCRGAVGRGFILDESIDLRTAKGLGKDYEFSTVAYKLYSRGSVPDDLSILADLEQMLIAYDAYMDARERPTPELPRPERIAPTDQGFRVADAIQEVISHIDSLGFVYQPWQIAQYITAVRTKPFVILAGITGTGKSKLPALIAAATGGESRLIPVRPDWTDSSEILGYTDLQGDFRPGAVLEIAHNATGDSDRHWTCIMDEMNLARVEQYFAEVLSKIENRHTTSGGGYVSGPLLGQTLREKDAEWGYVCVPPNLAFVGTVNMDESTHGFSRKVLDRAFTIELSEVYLDRWEHANLGIPEGRITAWPVRSWYPRAVMLAELRNLTADERTQILRAIGALNAINALLAPAQFQIGYRTRDEIGLFAVHARDIANAFVDSNGNTVDPLDLALQMKILPRIVGGSTPVRRAVAGLLGWAATSVPARTDEDARLVFQDWENAGRPSALPETPYPRLAARLCLMWERLLAEGYTSYWL